MGSVVKRFSKDGDPLYYARYKLPGGKWKWEAGGSKKKNAESILSRREREIAEGTYGQQEDITFADFADKWLKDYAAHKVKEKTLHDYTAIIENHLKPHFGGDLLGEISPGKVQGFVTAKMEQGQDPKKKEKKLSPTTVIKMVVVLKLMFKHAQIWGYIRENPARFVERPRINKKEMDYLTPDEVRRFLEAASPAYYPLFATAVFTGARQGELLALRWGDIDFRRGVIYIRRTYHPKYGLGEPKTEKAKRAISMSPELSKILAAHRPDEYDPEDLVFPNEVGNPIDAQNLVKRDFATALKKAKLRTIRFHDLRHTYASLMISLGENLKFIQHQMGHASITTTMDEYGHLLPEASERVGSRLDALVFSKKVSSITGARASK
jgi:integrase